MGLITERKVRQYYGAAADMASIPSGGKSTGDLYFTTDTKAVYRWDGSAWVGPVPGLWITAAMLAADAVETLKIKDANVTLVKLAGDAKGKFETQLLHAQDQKASGTSGGTFTSGAWRTRDLNTLLTNEIAGASLVANQITLPEGIYFITGSAPAYNVSTNKMKLYNITDAADLVIGQNSRAETTPVITSVSSLSGRFTVVGTKVLEVQHQCSTTCATWGFGNACGYGVVEVYADVHIWRVG
jgi:hypothetical protein